MNDAGVLLSLTVDGDPVPKGRPRTGCGRVYTPSRTSSAEDGIRLLARAQLRSRPPVTGPVAVEATFMVDTRRRCDLDNLLKLILDALNKVVWVDDDQVVEVRARKFHAPGRARTVITVTALTEAVAA